MKVFSKNVSWFIHYETIAVCFPEHWLCTPHNKNKYTKINRLTNHPNNFVYIYHFMDRCKKDNNTLVWEKENECVCCHF